MKRSLLFLLVASGSCLLDACSSGVTGPPPSLLSVSLNPGAAQALDVNQTVSITANLTGNSSNQGISWKVTCAAGGNACGGMMFSMSASGEPNKYAAPASLSSTQTVTVIATSIADSTKSAAVQVTVNPALALVNPAPVPQQTATAGAPFSLNLVNFVQGGTAPFTWSIVAGALPAGLALNSTTGFISGTPSTPGAPNDFTVTCTDSGSPSVPLPGTLELSLTINAPGSLTISSGALPGGTVGGAYGGTHSITGHNFTGFPLNATGGAPGYNWSWAAAPGSSLPPGLSLGLRYLSGGSTRCCVYIFAIGGTPTAAGTYNVVLTVTDSASPPAHVSMNYTITITPLTALAITSGAPPSGTVGVDYGPLETEYLQCHWNFYKGIYMVCGPCSLPGGCASLPYCKNFPATGLCTKTGQVIDGFDFTGSGGLPPYTWEIASGNSLPPGLNLTTDGTIAGTPTTPGGYNISVTLSDSATPEKQVSAAYGIVIVPPPPPVINTAHLLPIGTLGSPYVGFTFTAASGAPPFTWSEAGALPQGMSFVTSGLLSGTPTVAGKFLFTVTVRDSFGQNGTPFPLALQVLAQGFLPTGSMGTSRAGHTATLLTTGKVLVTGGAPFGYYQVIATAELFDPVTGTFSSTGSMGTPRVSHTATLLPDGRVLVTGGRDTTDNPVSTAEIYDPVKAAFSPTGNMETTRLYNTATLLKTGKVLVTGGLDVTGTFLASAELFDPSTGLFTPTGSMGTGRAGHTATLLNDGKVLVAGGDTATAEIYDPSNGNFTPTESMEESRVNHTATLLQNGMVLVTGGQGNFAPTLASTEVFNPVLGTFSPTGSMENVRADHVAVLLNDGTVLVAGGIDASTGLSFSSAELFDPASGTFTTTADLTAPRDSHTATVLENGKVLVTGGQNSGVTLATAELYH